MSSLPAAVTFDCWGTLIHEPGWAEAHARRVAALRAIAARAGRPLSTDAARAAFDAAWQRHLALWMRTVSSGPEEIAVWALESLDLATEPRRVAELADAVAEASLASEIQVLEGARDTLAGLAAAGVRRALVCDTGLSPGRVVRSLLARVDLLELLEVRVFSDEAGVTKPHARVFEAALGGLGVAASDAIHVGDLRRTDVAGGRGAGMRTVRIRHHHDDRSEHPEADWVVDSHADLQRVLGLA